jgi:hypothetical protein
MEIVVRLCLDGWTTMYFSPESCGAALTMAARSFSVQLTKLSRSWVLSPRSIFSPYLYRINAPSDSDAAALSILTAVVMANASRLEPPVSDLADRP